jgi:hypothetical protein
LFIIHRFIPYSLLNREFDFGSRPPSGQIVHSRATVAGKTNRTSQVKPYSMGPWSHMENCREPSITVRSDFNQCHCNSALVFPQNSISVQLNMSDQENDQLLANRQPARSRISSERWEQIKTAYAAGIGLREIARKMNIPEGTVLAHAKRHGWTQQLQVATREASVMQSDAITPVQSVAESLAVILSERKHRTKLGLSKYTAEAAERAGESDGDLHLSRNVRDVAAVHSTLWPEDHNERGILNIGVLTGAIPVYDAETGEVINGTGWKRKELGDQ